MRKRPQIPYFLPAAGPFGEYSPLAPAIRKVKLAQNTLFAVSPLPFLNLSATPDNITTSLLTKKIKSAIIGAFADPLMAWSRLSADPPFGPASPPARTRAGAVATWADVAELADAQGSGPCGLNPVEVRLLSSAIGIFWPYPCVIQSFWCSPCAIRSSLRSACAIESFWPCSCGFYVISPSQCANQRFALSPNVVDLTSGPS
jgi:hypothetical protein